MLVLGCKRSCEKLFVNGKDNRVYSSGLGIRGITSHKYLYHPDYLGLNYKPFFVSSISEILILKCAECGVGENPT